MDPSTQSTPNPNQPVVPPTPVQPPAPGANLEPNPPAPNDSLTVPAAPTVLPIEQPTTNVAPPPEPSKKRLIGAIVGVVVATVVAVSASLYTYLHFSARPANANVKVGVMMAFSGGSASMGYGANQGIQLAKKQLNANNLNFIEVDSKCEPKVAAQAIKRLIADKVIAIIGEGCSSASLAALPAANNAKIPMISPSASSPLLSIPNDYFFRVVPPDTFQGGYMAQTIYKKGYRRVAVFYTNEPYGTGISTVFRQDFENLGGQVVAVTSGEPDIIDLQSQIKQIKAAKPDAMFIAPNSVVSAIAAMKLAREQGVTAAFFGADIMYDNSIISNAPQAAEGLTITTFPTGGNAFRQAIISQSQKTAPLYAAPQAYDIVHIIQIAVQRGARTGEQVKNLLPSIQFNGVSSFKKFDQNGEVSNKDYKYDLFQVRNGAFTLLDQ